jgi:ABC-type glutathione transport system ATPase component
MQSFVEQAGILILASHSRPLMEATCDRAIWLDHGKVRAEGDVKEIADAYDAEMMRRQELRDAQAKAELERMRARQAAELDAENAARDGAASDADAPANFIQRLFRSLMGLFRR